MLGQNVVPFCLVPWIGSRLATNHASHNISFSLMLKLPALALLFELPEIKQIIILDVLLLLLPEGLVLLLCVHA